MRVELPKAVRGRWRAIHRARQTVRERVWKLGLGSSSKRNNERAREPECAPSGSTGAGGPRGGCDGMPN